MGPLAFPVVVAGASANDGSDKTARTSPVCAALRGADVPMSEVPPDFHLSMDPEEVGVVVLSDRDEIRRLRSMEAWKHVPILAIVQQGNDAEVEALFKEGVNDTVRADIKSGALAARLRSLLAVRIANRSLAARERDARVVLELTQTLASSLDFRTILLSVVKRVAEVAHIDRVSIVLVREQSNTAYVVAASDDVALRDLPIDLAKYPEIRHVVDSTEPLVIDDAAIHPLLDGVRKAEPSANAFSSVAILPILFEGRPMGVLFLRSRKSQTFSSESIWLFRTVASAMAISLRNARVMQSLRDQTQEVTVARFEAERRLRSMKRYADFFESSADGSLVIDLSGRVLVASRRAEEILGRNENELVGRSALELLDESCHKEVQKIAAGTKGGVYPIGVDLSAKRGDGSLIIVSVSASRVQGDEGVVICNFRDVTEERRVAVELVKTQTLLERVIDSSGDAIISADMQGVVRIFNRAAERIFRRKAKDVIGTDVRNFYQRGVAAAVMRAIYEGQGRVEGKRVDIVDGEGEAVPVSLSAALLEQGGAPVGTVGIFADLREKVFMERKLAQAQERLLEQERQAVVASLAGAAAHELNQPLQSVMAYAEIMRRQLPADAPSARSAEVIMTEAERMAEIVKKIGRITKYETKTYVGGAVILDLDRSMGTPAEGSPALELANDREKKGVL